MTQIFLKLFNMSITAGWIVLAVMVLRIFLKKAPKWVNCLLWGVVALRLMLPLSLESAISLVPSPEVIPQNITQQEAPAINSAIPAINSAVNPLFTGSLTPEENLLEKGLSIASIVWAVGVGIMLLYSLATYLRIRWQVQPSIRCEKNVYVCDRVASPFVLGLVIPKIYLPSGMEESQQSYVLDHENAHIKRGDHWWKPLGFLLLTVYWFNPLLWVAYILLCRDIEMACDEKVIATMDSAGKRGYSEALIACSVHRRMVMICPLAFGEVSVKSRIKRVLCYRKPAVWVAVAALIVCIMTAGCFLTNPLPCVHAYENEVLVEASCTSLGVEKRTCSRCRHMYTAYVDMSAHSYDQGVVTVTPTCARQGERSSTCVNCGQAVLTEVLAATDVHDMQETLLRKPTCADPGEGVKTCTRCGISERISYQMLEHHYVTGTVLLSTCAHNGSSQKICTGCGHEIWTTLPVSGTHSWIKLRDGLYQCALCGSTKTEAGYSSGYSLLNDVTGNPSQGALPKLPSFRWDPHP